MNKQPEIQNLKSKIAIVGAGPAGASLAIRLAQQNFAVTLIERERFPRHKLCGEFISPECLEHFRALGVLGEMLGAGGERLKETVFYSLSGRSVGISSEWLGSAAGALSLSRAEMDFLLLEKAKSLGVNVLEETRVTGILFENETVRGVKIKSADGKHAEIAADLTIDATGRANVLGKLAAKIQSSRFRIQASKPQIRSQKLVGFKAHLENVEMDKDRCEIYFFNGGYGGLSFVENDRANHCFLVKAETVKKFGGQAERIVEDVIFQNPRARQTLENARAATDWLAVSVDGFGLKNLNPAQNLFAVGDAAAFIDPFTGSGMLMALESAEIFAQIAAEYRLEPAKISAIYRERHRRKFENRLRVCAVLRRAAFYPRLAAAIITALGLSRRAQEFLARSTRESFAAHKNR